MLFSFIVFLVLTSIYECAGCDEKVPLPTEDHPVDIRKFNETWYETVTSFDPISLDHACRTYKDVKVNPTGFDAIVTIYRDNAQTISFPIPTLKTKEGYFRQKIVDKNNLEGNEDDESGHINSQAASEYYNLQWREYALLGDTDHCVAYVICGPTGWVVWAFTKQKAITAEHLIYIHNVLLKHGISVPLRLSRCQDILDS